jgi:hypothetical protein
VHHNRASSQVGRNHCILTVNLKFDFLVPQAVIGVMRKGTNAVFNYGATIEGVATR